MHALHTIRVAVFLARASPNRLLKTKRRQEKRGEGEKKKKKGERGEKGRTVPLNGPNAARAYEFCSFAKRCTRARIVFVFFARFSYVGGALFCFPLARKCSKMHVNDVLRQEDGGVCPF